METFRSASLRFVLVTLVVVSSLLGSASSAFANVRLPGGGVPFYARITHFEFYHTDDWAVIVFYRPPGCIPADFNLLDFFDVPAAFGCNPPTTSGYDIWRNGPGADPAPLLSEVHGLGAVPVWFVSWPDLQAAAADDTLTIGELASLAPLIGSASFYHEVLRPAGIDNKTIEFNARGVLEDGRTFQSHVQARGNGQQLFHTVVHIDFRR